MQLNKDYEGLVVVFRAVRWGQHHGRVDGHHLLQDSLRGLPGRKEPLGFGLGI